jgi:hypothetical protein
LYCGEPSILLGKESSELLTTGVSVRMQFITGIPVMMQMMLLLMIRFIGYYSS